MVNSNTPAAAIRVDSACNRSGLSMVNSVCPFFTSSPIEAKSADDPSLIGREDLHRHVLVEVDAADRLLLDREVAVFERLDLDGRELRIGQIDAVLFAPATPSSSSLGRVSACAAPPSSGFEPRPKRHAP